MKACSGCGVPVSRVEAFADMGAGVGKGGADANQPAA